MQEAIWYIEGERDLADISLGAQTLATTRMTIRIGARSLAWASRSTR